MRAEMVRFRALPAAERRAFVLIWLYLPVARLALAATSLARTRRLLAALPAGSSPIDAARLHHLVAAAAAHQPARPRCLPRALVLERLLRSRGVDCELVLGVAPSSGGLNAHAWVEVGGEAVGEGAESRERFRALRPVEVRAEGRA